MPTKPNTRLFLLRHAHSSWALPGQRDHQRPLDARGHAQAEELRALIAGRAFAFDRIVCSTATRAEATLDIVLGESLRGAGKCAERTNEPAEPQAPVVTPEICDGLYALGVDAYYEEARKGGTAILMIGHNPMIEAFALSLAGGGEDAALAALRRGLATCGMAIVDFAGPAGAIMPGAGHLAELIEPASRS